MHVSYGGGVKEYVRVGAPVGCGMYVRKRPFLQSREIYAQLETSLTSSELALWLLFQTLQEVSTIMNFCTISAIAVGPSPLLQENCIQWSDKAYSDSYRKCSYQY